MPPNPIEIDEVTRVFDPAGRRLVALDHVSFEVGPGEIVGLLGGNGAGKTTLTKILSTLLLPTSGTARVLGVDVVRDPRGARRGQSVVLGGDRGLYGQLTARDNLRFFGMLAGLSRRDLNARLAPSLDEVGLGDVADRKVSTFSKGMRQRLHIAIGLIARPRVLLLDEPTVGLDPVEANRLRTSIADLRQHGISVLLTSHYLLDVEVLADRLVMLQQGRVTHEMTVAEFTAAAGYAAMVVVRGRGPAPTLSGVDSADGSPVEIESVDGGWVASIRVREWSAQAFADLSSRLVGAQIDGVDVKPARLEDAFARLQHEVVK